MSTAPVLSAPEAAVPPVPLLAELHTESACGDLNGRMCRFRGNLLHGSLGVALSSIVCVSLIHLVYGVLVIRVLARLRL